MSGPAWWALSADGVAHLSMLQGPGLLITRCQQSLPPELGQSGGIPEGRRRCPECFAALLYFPDLVSKIPADRRSSPISPAPPLWVPSGQSAPALPVEPNPGGCPYCDAGGAVRVACVAWTP